ncbi:HSP20-like chaperone [Moorella glycerini]|uniref:Spore protein SP21 n=1 Tax=Neomoorella stamsii TaxID=1266720 RepID=A0A9X7J3L6_9FIRM|nr:MULTISPECIES: Hsp20/alpha crystallin family protein [Moorella]PRR73078.1 Spore protein SP21 [Moorella stamsii]CEP67716.1 HSP20-like chaperone [Moorella glycerini]
MSIGPWRPWRELADIREAMFRNLMTGLWEVGPRFDIYQTDREVVATAELPGLTSKDDVEITATEDTLAIRGEIRRSEETEEQNYHRAERFYGTFARTVSLPARVEPEKATATYKNGILEVRIPKAENQRQRRIPINLH